MEYTENMTFEEASHALMKDLKTRLADLHEHFDAQIYALRLLVE
jgi:hypothetical protein